MEDLLSTRHRPQTLENPPQPWLGQVQLFTDADQQTQQYTAIVAIWANSTEQYQHTLNTHLLSQHLQVLDTSKVMPAAQWLHQHPQDPQAGDLARSVHAAWPVAFGTLVPLTDDNNDTDTSSYLNISDLGHVEPLDKQWAVLHPKSVPDILLDPLFGQPEPSAATIARYSSIEDVPPLKTYAIIDSGRMLFFDDPSFVKHLPCRCLYSGSAAIDLGSNAPYLIELKNGYNFTRTLFTYLDDWHENFATMHAWHKEPGIYIRSRASFKTLKQHFKKFTKVQREDNGESVFFRFYNPRAFNTYIEGVSAPEQLALLREHTIITCLANGKATRYSIQEDKLHKTPASPMYSNRALQAVKNHQQHQLAISIADSITTDYSQYNDRRGDTLIALVSATIDMASRYQFDTDLAFGQLAAAVFIMGATPDTLPAPALAILHNLQLSENRRSRLLLEHALNTHHKDT